MLLFSVVAEHLWHADDNNNNGNGKSSIAGNAVVGDAQQQLEATATNWHQKQMAAIGDGNHFGGAVESDGGTDDGSWQQEWQQQQHGSGINEEGDGDDHFAASIFFHVNQNDAKMAAVLLCDVLGALCILLNAFVIVALIRNRRRVLVNVFYVLVLHCAIVDLIRGGCLIAWGMPHLLIHTMRSIQDRLTALKINQFTLVILRSCNLLTIFNLLVFTTNEFIVIKYPLHYRRYFRRRTVLLILAICWLVSLLFGVGSVFSNFFESSHTLMVLSNGTSRNSIFRALDDDAHAEEDGAMSPEFVAAFLAQHGEEQQRSWTSKFKNGNVGEEAEEEEEDGKTDDQLLPPQLLMRRFDAIGGGKGVTRRQMAGLSINVLSMLMIFVLCYVCLFTVLVCYGKILRTIREFQKCGGLGPSRRVLQQQQSQSAQQQQQQQQAQQEQQQQQRFGHRNGSIYHRRLRSVHQQRTQHHHHHQQLLYQQQQNRATAQMVVSNIRAVHQQQQQQQLPRASVIGVDIIPQPATTTTAQSHHHCHCCSQQHDHNNHNNTQSQLNHQHRALAQSKTIAGGTVMMMNASGSGPNSFAIAVGSETSPASISSSLRRKKSARLSQSSAGSGSCCGGGSATADATAVASDRSCSNCSSNLANSGGGATAFTVSTPGNEEMQQQQLEQSKRCNSHRKWRTHLMSRHKYLIVIGTVLFVDVLFLFPYSGIQMVALLHLNNLLATSQLSTLIRWGLQILIGIHSVCQPLCYFRMTEFRRLACCLGGAGSNRRFGGSGGGGSSGGGSIFAPANTFRASKTASSVKAIGMAPREEEANNGGGDGTTTTTTAAMVTKKRSIVLGMVPSGGGENGGSKGGSRGGGGCEQRTDYMNPSVNGRQMLLIAQRRKWTRNLSLLCTEEGEDLEVFLQKEFRRKNAAAADAAGGNLGGDDSEVKELRQPQMEMPNGKNADDRQHWMIGCKNQVVPSPPSTTVAQQPQQQKGGSLRDRFAVEDAQRAMELVEEQKRRRATNLPAEKKSMEAQKKAGRLEQKTDKNVLNDGGKRKTVTNGWERSGVGRKDDATDDFIEGHQFADECSKELMVEMEEGRRRTATDASGEGGNGIGTLIVRLLDRLRRRGGSVVGRGTAKKMGTTTTTAAIHAENNDDGDEDGGQQQLQGNGRRHQQRRLEPTLLMESGWRRPRDDVHQFRSHGKAGEGGNGQQMKRQQKKNAGNSSDNNKNRNNNYVSEDNDDDEEEELLSGLRSNSVFTASTQTLAAKAPEMQQQQ